MYLKGTVCEWNLITKYNRKIKSGFVFRCVCNASSCVDCLIEGHYEAVGNKALVTVQNLIIDKYDEYDCTIPTCTILKIRTQQEYS